MPDTAILLSAQGTDRIHAHRPDETETLCGLTVIDAEDIDVDEPMPPRSADWTGRRYYIGVQRLMCQRCTTEAMKVRVVGSGRVGFPLAELRAVE